MGFPAFFDTAPTLRVHDALSQLLGATDDGLVEYRYVDAVRLAGHSCPTVAGAYLMGRAAMRALYPGMVPERGDVDVTLPEAEDAGVTGVMAQVLTLLTGAAADNGFKGLAGRHVRCGLLHFQPGAHARIVFRRHDNGARAHVTLNLASIPPDPAQRTLLGNILHGHAAPGEREEFARLWQDRVRRLLERADDPQVIGVALA